MKTESLLPAPELDVSEWLNTDAPITLQALRGKVVVIHAFQMLCPGCVTHGLPQAQAVHSRFSSAEVQVIGLHSVFEHHQVMTPEALRVYIHEFQLDFPVAIDKPSESGPLPKTMQAYQLAGTPSLILIDQEGFLRLNYFGRLDDMLLGSFIGRLLVRHQDTDNGIIGSRQNPVTEDRACDDKGCPISGQTE